MKLRSTSLDDAYCFFLISGMNHCTGGDGACVIGNRGGASQHTTEQTPQNNVFLRIIDWVENGNAPDTVTSHKYVNVRSSNMRYANYVPDSAGNDTGHYGLRYRSGTSLLPLLVQETNASI